MRAPLAFFVACLTAGCGSVPDLNFDDGSDGGSSATLPDASLPPAGHDASVAGGDDASPPSSGDDATTPPPGDDASIDSAIPPPPDGNAPPPDAGVNTNTCPGKTPSGAQCCLGTSIECRPASTFSICDCLTCDKKCDSDNSVCCMDKNGNFESCVADLADCPKL